MIKKYRRVLLFLVGSTDDLTADQYKQRPYQNITEMMLMVTYTMVAPKARTNRYSYRPS